jgi:hypothetical protein
MLNHQTVLDIMEGLHLEHIGAIVDTTRTLSSGFHPMYAKDTPNGACLFLDEPEDNVAVGWVVTGWDGEVLNPRIPITGPPADTVEDAVNKVIKLWADMLHTMRTGTPHSMPELIEAMVPARTRSSMSMLRVGDHIAYLLPDIPPFLQEQFVTTKVMGVSPLVLANGHHKTIFASGRGEVARYNPETGRVVFPVRRLIDVCV